MFRRFDRTFQAKIWKCENEFKSAKFSKKSDLYTHKLSFAFKIFLTRTIGFVESRARQDSIYIL